MKRQTAGFTLIELVIVLLIVAVLAAIALPSYTNYIVRGNRAAAQSYMLDLAQREQQFLLDNRGYANQATLFALLPPPSQVAAQYTVQLLPAPDNTATPPTYTINAAPIAGTIQAREGEPTLTLNQAGTKVGSKNGIPVW